MTLTILLNNYIEKGDIPSQKYRSFRINYL